ncbi:hypothetical protein MGG_15538 [Pyricularia oryzae 70-15]|uniref:Uncharacterized protein n=3 Tax=Pyricularia oryzae TaxID=318829 RepID=G4MZF5_PYRO7|nr:uncharacterized protein MGG_15538 [Pyricularia oryzae 70-15]EHA53710.1 hypothetical protein MGG_15538 [Pyricularia oryzae 70-15]ELQ34858.1 hypothetical protein OOU_Y34scaffold00744g22 [Pyricularia oryzae Y34]
MRLSPKSPPAWPGRSNRPHVFVSAEFSSINIIVRVNKILTRRIGLYIHPTQVLTLLRAGVCNNIICTSISSADPVFDASVHTQRIWVICSIWVSTTRTTISIDAECQGKDSEERRESHLCREQDGYMSWQSLPHMPRIEIQFGIPHFSRDRSRQL